MTRRRYPILGRPELKLSDASKRPSKPVYLELEILGGRSWDQSGLILRLVLRLILRLIQGQILRLIQGQILNNKIY